MQQPLPTPPQPQPENKCPDCLYMELEGILLQPEPQGRGISKLFQPKQKSSEPDQIDLHLTINFNEQWEPLRGGRVKFGLKGGELRLKLENSKIPYESRELAGKLELSVQKERQQQEASEKQSGIEASLVESKPGVKANVGSKETAGTTDKFQFTDCQITTKGSEENPAWVFEVETGEPVLKGLLKNEKLGTLDVKTKPCRVEATFEVSKRDVHLTDGEGLYPPDISRNKRAIIERTIALHLLKSKLEPYLSRVVLQYD